MTDLAAQGLVIKQAKRDRTILAGLALCLCAASYLSLHVGAVATDFISPAKLAALIKTGPQSTADFVLVNLRLPRLALAILSGGALAMSGALLQALLRNPLADPGLIGVSSGAAVGAGLFIVFGAGMAAAGLPIAAFIGGLIAILCVYVIGNRSGAINIATIILAGVAINAIGGAIIGLFSFISDDTALRNLTFWMLGSVASAGWREIGLICLPVMIASAMAWRPTALNLYGLGDATARSLGCNTVRLKQASLLAVAIMVGATVSLTGMIGFVGLVIPHALRLIGCTDYKVLLPGAWLGGGLMLVCADMLARSIAAPADMPIGIITGLIGGPFFVWLLLRQGASHHA